MQAGDLEVASEFCRLVQTADLFEYLGVSAEDPTEEVLEALTRNRRRMQSMQNNPKFKDAARFLIKNYARLERVVVEPEAHLEAMRREREDEHIPMLVLALEAMMLDGRVTAEEEAFLRQASVRLGIRESRYEDILAEKVAEHGVLLEVSLHGSDMLTDAFGHEVTGVMPIPTASPEAARTERLRSASAKWWDKAFTRLLLECVPGGPGEMVDLYCRTGGSAVTLLPERPQLSWTGVDPRDERLEEASKSLTTQGLGRLSRITLLQGEPDALPVDSLSMDYVVAIRALANRVDTRPVFDEAWRVLRPGGRVIVAEPDGLAEAFYFRGPLWSYNAAFQAMSVEVDRRMAEGAHEAGRPGLTIGPTLPKRMAHAGFEPGQVRVHASHNLKPQRFDRLARRLRRYPTQLAQAWGLQDSLLLKAVLHEVDKLERELGEDAVGMAGHLLPIFLVVGAKEGG